MLPTSHRPSILKRPQSLSTGRVFEENLEKEFEKEQLRIHGIQTRLQDASSRLVGAHTTTFNLTKEEEHQARKQYDASIAEDNRQAFLNKHKDIPKRVDNKAQSTVVPLNTPYSCDQVLSIKNEHPTIKTNNKDVKESGHRMKDLLSREDLNTKDRIRAGRIPATHMEHPWAWNSMAGSSK